MKKEEKEQLYEVDPFIKAMQKGIDGVASRRRTAIKIIGVAIALFLIIAAAAIVNEVKTDVRLAAIDSAKTLDELERVAVKYPQPDLQIKVGIAYAVAGEKRDLAKAETWLKKAATSSKPLYKSQANIALGKVMMEQKKYDEALASFKAARSPEAAMLSEELDWLTARCYELTGKTEEAKSLYASIAAHSPATVWTELAARRQSELKNQ